MLELKQSDFRPAYKNQLNFDHQHKTESIDPHKKSKSFSARTQKPTPFWPPHKNMKFRPKQKRSQVRCPRTQQARLISIQTLHHVIFNPHTETKWIPIPTLKSSQFRSSAQKSSLFRPPTQQSSQIRCQNWNHVCHFRPVLFCVLYIWIHVPVIQQHCVSRKYQ